MSACSRAFLPLAAAVAAVAVSPAAATAAAKPKAPVEALLSLHHPAGLERFVEAVSDPASPRYRRYITVERAIERFGASRRARAATVSYLRAHGLDAEVGVTGTYVLARGSRAAVASALPAAAPRSAGGATDAVGVPAALRGAVADASLLGPAAAPAPKPVASAAAVTPEDPYNGLSPTHGSARERSGTPAGCPAGTSAGTGELLGFTPNQTATAYGLDTLHADGLRGQGMHVALVETGGFHRSDVETFAACFGVQMPKLRFHNVSGGKRPAALDETTLDIEVMLGALPRLSRMDVYSST
ncbi:MAG TPA: protease pro-enzyme activation domain-containing protein, partial [Capillimicrobium sp.]